MAAVLARVDPARVEARDLVDPVREEALAKAVVRERVVAQGREAQDLEDEALAVADLVVKEMTKSQRAAAGTPRPHSARRSYEFELGKL